MPDPTREERAAEARLQKKKKVLQAQRYAAYREQRKERLSPPALICPPDLSIASSRKRILGTLFRFLVVFFAVFGMGIFVSDAFGYSDSGLSVISFKALFFEALLLTALLALPFFIRRKYVALPVTVLGILGLCAYFFYFKNGLILPQDAFVGAFNVALRHMADLGYFALGEKLLSFPVDTADALGMAPYLEAAVFAFLVLIALLYVLCLGRRIRLWKLLGAGLISAAILFVIFEYNITRSNWGVALLIASFTGALVMAACDFVFLRKQKNASDTVFADENAPAYPAILRRRDEEKAAKKQETVKTAAERAEKEAAPRTVDEEISDYFSTGRKKPEKAKKEKSPALSPAERKEKRAKAREEQKELRAFRAYHNQKSASAAAAGGFSGFAAFVLAMVLLFFPACTSTGPNTLFDRAGKQLEDYREYITAILMGDAPALNTLAYEHDDNHFEAQDTAPHALYFTGEKLFTVESNLRNAVYMRGWVGTTYNNATGAWNTPAPESPMYSYYREQFGTESAPPETMLYNFWNLTEPGSIPDPAAYEYPKLNKINSSLGFATGQINILREKGNKSTTLYLPAFTLPQGSFLDKTDNGKTARFLRAFGSAGQSDISYANVFDGIYSAYGLTHKNDGISTVSVLTTMKSEGFYRTLADNIAEVNAYRKFLLGIQDVSTADGTFTIPNDFGTETLAYRLEYRTSGGAKLGYPANRPKNGAYPGSDGCLYILVPQKVGTAVYKTQNGEVLSKTMEDIPADKLVDEDGTELYYTAPALPLAIRYAELMTDEERAAVAAYLKDAEKYTNYVYRFYPTSQENDRIHALATEIASNATKEEVYTVKEVFEDSGETYDAYHTRTVPADFSLAGASALTGGASLTTEAVRQRHELVMEVIDYLAKDERFTYTLTPRASLDESLVGVEKFLFDTKEGSCVQFATAAALLLRDFGIPVRFVNGYIATDFRANRAEDRAGTYVSTVRDSSAHAWIEVWYDYVGWVQYECTPAFYGEMYNVPAKPYDPSDVPETPDLPDEPIEDEPVIEEPEYTAEELAEMERLRLEAEWKAAVRKVVTVVLIAVGAAAVLFLLWLFFWRRAKKAQAKRDALVAKIANADTEAPTHEEYRQLMSMTDYLLGLCRLAPQRGEFREEYAVRLAKACSASLQTPTEAEGIKEHDKPHYALTEERMKKAFAAVAAEEFGFGAPVADMPLLARFYRRMRAFEYPHRVGLVRRVWLWFFRAKI